MSCKLSAMEGRELKPVWSGRRRWSFSKPSLVSSPPRPFVRCCPKPAGRVSGSGVCRRQRSSGWASPSASGPTWTYRPSGGRSSAPCGPCSCPWMPSIPRASRRFLGHAPGWGPAPCGILQAGLPVFVATSAPIAFDQTRGAFYKGMRLMAIDGVRFEIPDTPVNAAAFGRPRTRRNGQSIEGAYPQIHAIFLTETGTHMVVEAYLKRGKKSEFKVATSLSRKAPSGFLVLQDRGFYGYPPLAEAIRRGSFGRHRSASPQLHPRGAGASRDRPAHAGRAGFSLADPLRRDDPTHRPGTAAATEEPHQCAGGQEKDVQLRQEKSRA